jgi:DNA modification methylase
MVLRTEHHIRFGDARDLGWLADGSVDLVVTSPPYPMIELWDGLFAGLDPQAGEALARADGQAAFAAMHRVLDAVWAEVFRVLRPGGITCLNVGDATRTLGGEFQLYPNHARVIQRCAELGFRSLPDIIWRKPTNAPTKFVGSGMHPAGAYVTLEHEWILVLRKGGLRRFTGPEERQRRRLSCFFWEERNCWFSDLWSFTGARQDAGQKAPRSRSCAFPFEVPWRLIQMFSVQGDLVLDPFLGAGTTLLAAMAAGRSSVGAELEGGCREQIRRGIGGIVEQARRLTGERLARHVGFMRDRETGGKPGAYRNRNYGFPVVTRQEQEIQLPLLAAVRPLGPDAWTAEYATAENAPGGSLAGQAGQDRPAVQRPLDFDGLPAAQQEDHR